MQNTRVSQKGMKGMLFGVFAVMVLALGLIAASPHDAYAKSYTMPKVDIAATAATDASLNVVEQRTFSFDGDFTAVWWTFDGLPGNASLKVNGVSLTKVDSSGNAVGEAEQLPEESFVLSWRDSGGPGNDSYSVDAPMNTVYVFFSVSDEDLMVTLDYTIVNGVQAYKDVAEVYWQYVSSGWAEDSDNVSMTLTLPMPEGTTAVPEENVWAWGHGPLDGSVTINGDGTVDYTVPHVSSGQYAEARVEFPTDWLTDLSGDAALAHKDENHLDTVLKEEQSWADQANLMRQMSLLMIIGFGVLAVLVLLWAIRAYFKYGKEYAPQFTDDYWRDVPSPGDHPTVMARLWRWNRESNEDFTATLMHLSHLGAIQINKGTYDKPGVFGSKVVDDYYLTRVPSVEATLQSPIDLKAMDFLFNTVAEGQPSLWFATIQKFGKDNPETFVNGMKEWQGQVTAEVNKRDFFDFKSQKMQMVMVAVAIVFAIIGVGACLMLENFIPLIFVIPVAIALFVIANYMPRRTQEGSTLDAKCKALKKWLKDFSALDERPPTDVKVWGEFMVYAFIFGVAKQVIEALRLKVPELFQDDASVMGTTYVPWWFWYSPMYGSSGSVMPSAADMFQTSVSNTVQTAQAAMSAASGNWSGGGGGGGGFSMGGGGGFGGGGGAR